MSQRQLTLASASPSRLRLLLAAGVEPNVMVSGVDEDAVVDALAPLTDAAGVAVALAQAKAREVAASLGDQALVVGCDSVFVVDGEILGKPETAETARSRWRQMRGNSGTLITGHCLIDTTNSREVSAVAETTVLFADVSDAEVDWYVASGEPLQVAGSFTLDGRAAPFVVRIDGDPSNVIGLSLPLLRTLLGSIGIDWTSITHR